MLFDLENTLFKLGKEEDWDWVAIHKEAFEKIGLNIDEEQLQQVILGIPKEILTEKGLRVGVISNSEGLTIIDCERMGLAQHLEFVIDSAHVGVRKPDVLIFQIAIKALQLNCKNRLQPDEVMYVGNELETDALGAKAAGMAGVWLNRDDQRIDSRVPTIHSLDDIVKLLF